MIYHHLRRVIPWYAMNSHNTISKFSRCIFRSIVPLRVKLLHAFMSSRSKYKLKCPPDLNINWNVILIYIELLLIAVIMPPYNSSFSLLLSDSLFASSTLAACPPSARFRISSFLHIFRVSLHIPGNRVIASTRGHHRLLSHQLPAAFPVKKDWQVIFSLRYAQLRDQS